MVLDLECMLLDPASVVERCEREVEKNMASRHDQIDRIFNKYEERKELMAAARIRSRARNINELEAVTALEDCSNDEEAVIAELKHSEFLKKVRETIEDRYYNQEKNGPKRVRPNKSNVTVESRWDLPLRNALIEQVVDISEVDTTTWTRAHREAYSRFREAPNTYLHYYRLPGEDQRHGPWDEKEHEEFLRLLDEAGGWEAAKSSDMQWGILSAGLNGRVGFQCSNHFNQLIREKRRRYSEFHHEHRRNGELLAEDLDTDSVIEGREYEWDKHGGCSDDLEAEDVDEGQVIDDV
jgi:hypothetical protein